MKYTLKNRPKLGEDAWGEDYEEWFEGFEKRQREIHDDPDMWYEKNLIAIMKRSHSGLRLREIVAFFIEKEILGK